MRFREWLEGSRQQYYLQGKTVIPCPEGHVRKCFDIVAAKYHVPVISLMDIEKEYFSLPWRQRQAYFENKVKELSIPLPVLYPLMQNPRDFAVNHLHLIRLIIGEGITERHDVADMRLLTSQNLLSLAHGLYELNKDAVKHRIITIETHEPKKIYGNLSFNQIVLGDISDIQSQQGVSVTPKRLKESKEPWQMTSKEFMQHHYTGHIGSDAYRDYETKDGLSWVKYDRFNEHYATLTFGGVVVEIRRDNTLRKYTKRDANDELMRGPDGIAILMSPKEIEASGYKKDDGTLAAFINKEAVGLAADEFGTAGVWVIAEMQKKGLGTYLLKELLKTHPRIKKIGQMTIAGVNMANSYHRSMIKDAVAAGKPVPKDVIASNGFYPAQDSVEEASAAIRGIPRDLSELLRVEHYVDLPANKLFQLAKKSRSLDVGNVRGILDLDNDSLIWWPASETIHDYVVRRLGIGHFVALWLTYYPDIDKFKLAIEQKHKPNMKLDQIKSAINLYNNH